MLLCKEAQEIFLSGHTLESYQGEGPERYTEAAEHMQKCSNCKVYLGWFFEGMHAHMNREASGKF